MLLWTTVWTELREIWSLKQMHCVNIGNPLFKQSSWLPKRNSHSLNMQSRQWGNPTSRHMRHSGKGIKSSCIVCVWNEGKFQLRWVYKSAWIQMQTSVEFVVAMTVLYNYCYSTSTCFPSQVFWRSILCMVVCGLKALINLQEAPSQHTLFS